MAQCMTRTRLDCSSSHRCTGPRGCLHGALPAAQAWRPAPVAHVLAPQPERPCPSRAPPSIPSGARVARTQRLQPLRVAEQVAETEESETEPTIDLEALNKEWGIPGVIEFGVGQGDLPTVLITHPQTGMAMVVYLYGATIAQWLKSDGTATFYDGPDHLYQPGMPLRTGVSLHFPQHREGLLPEHGFADRMLWEVEGAGLENLELINEALDFEHYMADEEAKESGRAALLAAFEEADRLKEQQQQGESAEGQEEQEADAAGTAGQGQQEGEAQEGGQGEQDDGPVVNLMGQTDMAPFVMLRLRDTAETRKLWPHKFTLLYKVTLMTQDEVTDADMDEIKASNGLLPNGLPVDQEGADDVEDPHEVRYRSVFIDDEDEELLEGVEGQEEEEQQAEDQQAPGPAPAPAAPKRRGRTPKKLKEAAAAAAGAEAEAGGVGGIEEEVEDFDDEEDVEEELGGDKDSVGPEPIRPAVQIKQEFWVFNNDEPGSEPMQFNLGSLARFMTLQQPQNSAWIKVLGLGGAQVFDYTADPRYPQMYVNEEDFTHFEGQPIDKTYVGASDATIYLCPGNRTHFEFIQREGFPDMFVEHPGHNGDPDMERMACMGTGYVATKKKLEAGGMFHAESVIRFHNRYFTPPVFGDDSMPPLPAIPMDQLVEGMGGDGEAEEDAFGDIAADVGGVGGEE